MPLALNRGDRRLLVFAGIVLALMLGVAFVIASGTGDRGEATTSYSSSSAGCKAVYLLLAELGYRVERWEDPPSDLSDPASTTLVLAEPTELATESERAAIEAFMRAGGFVIATGPDSAWFVSGHTSPRLPTGHSWNTMPAIAPSSITAAAPEIAIASRAAWDGDELRMTPLYGDVHGPSVVEMSVGNGRAMWWEAATPLTNAGITASNNLAFVLASIGGPERRILWDEYFHGRRRTLAASIWHSPTKWIGLQLAIVCLVVLLTYARRSGPIIPPAQESRLSPLEFVRTLGSLYERAKVSSVAVEAADRRARYGLAR
ncbi:MAG TPA: DUF4350 domain-containing protein, partial [Vicinamibacterales bacterium]|nr:DUF4350 domain-containing protein [Vicinamibacterales bacterium]